MRSLYDEGLLRTLNRGPTQNPQIEYGFEYKLVEEMSEFTQRFLLNPQFKKRKPMIFVHESIITSSRKEIEKAKGLTRKGKIKKANTELEDKIVLLKGLIGIYDSDSEKNCLFTSHVSYASMKNSEQGLHQTLPHDDKRRKKVFRRISEGVTNIYELQGSLLEILKNTKTRSEENTTESSSAFENDCEFYNAVLNASIQNPSRQAFILATSVEPFQRFKPEYSIKNGVLTQVQTPPKLLIRTRVNSSNDHVQYFKLNPNQ